MHDFGEYFNIFPCDECGFMAGDIKESLEHRANHLEVGDKRRTPRSIDEDWDLNQSVERLLQEEDEDDEEFFFNCKKCNYQTIWQDTFNQHMQWQHDLPLKTAKQKFDTSVGGPVSKKSKEPTCRHLIVVKFGHFSCFFIIIMYIYKSNKTEKSNNQ